MTDQEQPNNQIPTPDRHAKLWAARDANLARGNPPYNGIKIRTLGELQWILQQEDWSGDRTVEGKRRPDLRGTSMYGVNLEQAKLFRARLEGADLAHTNLEGADLGAANLMGARLWQANLARANLREVVMDEATRLRDIIVDENTKLSDVAWNGALLTRVELPDHLGDEQDIRKGNRRKRISALRNAARGYRGLALILRQQGLLKRASDYRLREQRLERRAYLLEGNVLAWTGLLLLDLIAGYGERLGRIFVAYGLIVIAFAAAFLISDLVSGHATLTVQQMLDSLQISLNAVHGRVFFAQFHLDTLQSWLATSESIIGIVIEGVFVAMLIQRFFAR